MFMMCSNADHSIRYRRLNSNYDLRGSPRGRLWCERKPNNGFRIRVCGVARNQCFQGFLSKIAEKVSIPFFRIPPNVRTTVRLLKRALVLFALVMQARRKEGPQVTRSVTWRWMRQVRKRVKYLIRLGAIRRSTFPKGKAKGARRSSAIQWSPASINTRLLNLIFLRVTWSQNNVRNCGIL